MPASRRQMHRIVSIALALSIALASLPAVAAPAPTPTQIGDARQQAADAHARIAKMQADLNSGMASYNSAASDLAKTRAQIAANTKRLDALNASLKNGEAELRKRADFLYRTGGVGFIDVVFGSHSFDQFASRLYVVTRIANQEAQLVTGIKKDRAEAATVRTELAQREKAQAALLGKVAAQRDSVQSALDRQQAYADSLSADVAALLAAQARQDALATPVAASPKQTSSSSGGSSSVPVGLASATVEGRSGTYAVMSDEPRKYTPTSISFSGECSVFSAAEGSDSTASGRKLVDSDLVCAHKTLPFGTRIAITRGSSRVIVTVIDRGPYTHGRVLDVTPRVARVLGLDGVGQVHAEVVRPL